MIGDDIFDENDEKVGNLEEIMIDLDRGRIAYAVLSFGGILGMGDKLFAIPWDALRVDAMNENLVTDVDKDALEDAPGFDKDDWPETVEHDWLTTVYDFYGYEPYWR
jgi:sporulation protein YlmC with PRC-barrel domain